MFNHAPSKALLANELDAALVTLPIAEALFEKVTVHKLSLQLSALSRDLRR